LKGRGAGSGEQRVKGGVGAVEQEEGTQQLTLPRRVAGKPAHQHRRPLVHVDDRPRSVRALGDAARHHAVEQLLHAGPEARDVEEQEEALALLDLVAVWAGKEEDDVQAHARDRPDADYGVTREQIENNQAAGDADDY